LAKPSVSRKGPRARAISQKAIAPTLTQSFKLSSSSYWFSIWAPVPAPSKMPSSSTAALVETADFRLKS